MLSLRPDQVPLPPEKLRRLVCPDDAFFSLEPGTYEPPHRTDAADESVLDFGCGCGRIARQLLVASAPPASYVGIDIHREMIRWCQESLQPLREGFRFEHHDVYNKNLGADNSRVRGASFPVENGSITSLFAHSVFTHLALDQTIFYLHETRRVLRPGGVAKTTWFLFSPQTFPMLSPGQVTLFINEDDPTNAVIYSWVWLRQAFTDSGFRIREVIPPGIPGHQWQIFIEPRTDDADDALPTLEELKAGLCAVPSDESELRTIPHKVKVFVEEQETPVTTPPTQTEAQSTPPDSGRRIVLKYSSVEGAQGFRERVADSESWYHSYYFDNGFYVRGDYDIGADVADYGFPESMQGMRILDIGSGAGWFSHYFEQLGAEVTAVDARGYEDFDVYGRAGYPEVTRPPDRYHEGRPIHFSPVNQQFWIMKDLLGSRIRFYNARVYEVGDQVLKGEKFDLVFLGALLCHLRDPIGALQAARSVCGGRVMASTPVVIGEPTGEVQPRQYLPYTEYDRISWWLPNEECFEHWFKAAGFIDVSAGPQVRLRADKVRYRDDGRPLNESQWLRVGSGVV